MGKSKETGPYLERDISWMYFNRRVLQEACKDEVPLLERLNFLGIYSNNLDEFFRVRVASQNRVAEWDGKAAAGESKAAADIVKQLGKINGRYAKEFDMAVAHVNKLLADNNICIISDTEADEEQLNYIRSYYQEKIDGFVVPIWLSAVRYLDYETDEKIYLAVKAGRYSASGKTVYDYAYFSLPVRNCGRFVRLPDKEGKSYIMYIDDVIRCCLPKVFEGNSFVSFSAYTFKFTRDAEMEIDNDQRNGILQKIAKGLRSRKKGEPLRFIYDGDMPEDLLRRVLSRLDLGERDTVMKGGRYQNHKDLMKFPDFPGSGLKYPPMPAIHRASLCGPESLLERIRVQDRFLHVPYHSFDSFIRVLHEAAISRNVSSIKITLYRLAKDSKVVRALIAAARNGKKVTVVIELLARFDEESNMQWSQKLEEAGVRVIFGVEGLKVHSKVLHIGMKKGPDIACISTGNFHEGNARAYTDCILMTSSRRIVKEVDEVFDFIEKPYSQIHFKELLVSPNEMKKKFISLINTEIRNKKNGKPAYIKMKVNHITDPEMVNRLYCAAYAGVDIDLSVRGNCSLVTDKLPENCHMRINGIIDRYLEHSRIFIFAAGGEEKVFIGSADWMPRNLDNRIEVVVPVYDPTVKQEMKRIVDYALRDVRQGRTVDGTGRNQEWTCVDPLKTGSQQALYQYYQQLEEKEVQYGDK
ncbi:MAG TPA: RNA degradosome polyphosphate kinase [Candidatus Coprenecus stercoravium]|uniref:Polyphosphate kinase n=1 Tax=Candidatus Coprenecus stercoravium TaxID=2840735 RepID=A0A9D2K9J9_9BACT|nr:RNA degradosome polyphosphate kinase [Candidatus Coprenecus stercoravium]